MLNLGLLEVPQAFAFAVASLVPARPRIGPEIIE
jgi:hypothetical protein